MSVRIGLFDPVEMLTVSKDLFSAKNQNELGAIRQLPRAVRRPTGCLGPHSLFDFHHLTPCGLFDDKCAASAGHKSLAPLRALYEYRGRLVWFVSPFMVKLVGTKVPKGNVPGG